MPDHCTLRRVLGGVPAPHVLRAYLVTDHLVNRRGLEPKPDASGSLAEFVTWLEAVLGVDPA